MRCLSLLVTCLLCLLCLGSLEAAEPQPAQVAPGQSGIVVEQLSCKKRAADPARLVPGDDIDAMEQHIKPPARFGDHQCAWRVERRRFTFAHYQKEVTKTYMVVWDGPRCVALIRSGDILMLAQTPDQAPTDIVLPTERLHLDNLPGPSLPTWPFIRKVSTHGSIYQTMGEQALPKDELLCGPQVLTYRRRQQLPEYSVVADFDFRVDPIYGYRIDGHRDLRFKESPKPDSIRLGAGTFTPGCYVPWSYAALYDRTVYTPAHGGMTGWANNCIIMDRCDANRRTFNWRDKGFIAFLAPQHGWSPCFTRKDGAGQTRKLNVCNAHNDFHITLFVPPLATLDEQGRYQYRYVHRLLHLPPEMVAHVWDKMDVIGQGQRGIVLGLGEVDDLEQQPKPLTEAARGLIWTSGGPKITQEQARSGKNSMRFSGRQWPNLPQVSLQPGLRYRLEAWVLVKPWSKAEREAAAQRELVRNQKRLANGDKAQPLTDWNTVQEKVRIVGDYYEWSPYRSKMLQRLSTNAADSSSSDWQHISVDFTAPAWGPFINIAFEADYCTAYLDDFALRVLPAN